MSDEVKIEQTEQAKGPEQQSQRDADEKLGEGGIKALQAERDARAAAEARAKAAEAEAEKLRRATESEAERVQRERDEAVTAAAAKDAMISRYEAAEAAGLPLSWAKRLVGSTAEELLADAKSVAADLAEKAKPGTPKPDPSQGSGGAKAGGSVAAGRDLYADMHKKKTTSTF